MRQKKVKALRKQLGLKLPVAADLRVAKKVKKIAYFEDKLTGEKKAVPVERVVVVNAAKYQYRQIKKIIKGQRSL